MDDAPYSAETPAAEVLQTQETVLPEVPVHHRAPVRTQELPADRWSAKTWNVGTTGLHVLGPDPRRKTMTLLSFDQEIRLGASQSEVTAVNGTSGARWPKALPLVLEHADGVWVASATSTTDVSVIVEYWAP